MLPVRLAIFCAAHLEVRAMQPGMDERLPGRRFRLGDFVLVMGEHRGRPPRYGCRSSARGIACSSPSTRCATPVAPRRPRSTSWARPPRCPFHSAKSRTSSLLYSSASTRSPTRCWVRVDMRKSAIGRPAGDAEEDRAVIHAVRVPLRKQRRDERGHVGDVLGGARHDVRARDPQPPESTVERAALAPGVSSAMGTPSRPASRMILSSTSVTFMTQVTASPFHAR